MSTDSDPVAMHEWFDWSPIVSRSRLTLPEGKRVAFTIVVSIEYYEMYQPAGAIVPLSLPGGFGRSPYPDFRTFSHREYGNRIGVFRVMDVLDRYGLRATAAIDGKTANERNVIVQQCLSRNWEIAGHGLAVTRLLSSRLTEEEERAQILEVIHSIERASGRIPRGWHGAEYGESQRTPNILASMGLEYVLDWPNDELPYAMRTDSGPLISMPMLVDFDDVFAHWHRKLTMDRWRRSIADALDQMLIDATAGPRMLVLNLHPWLIGQPWRISYLEEVLEDARRRDGIWFATAGEIAAWYASATAKA